MHFANSPKMAAAALISILLGLPQLAHASKPSNPNSAAAKCEAMIDQSPNNRRLMNASGECKAQALALTASDRSEPRSAPVSRRGDEQIYDHDERQYYGREYRHNDDRRYDREYDHRDHHYNRDDRGRHSERAYIRQLDRLNWEIDQTRAQIRELKIKARYSHGHGYHHYEHQLRDLGYRLDWLKDRKRDLKRRRNEADHHDWAYRSQG